jgi:hypothetical protein
MKEPQMAVGLENLVDRINWILAIGGQENFNRYLAFLPLVRQCASPPVRQGFKPLAHSESPLKRTEDCIFLCCLQSVLTHILHHSQLAVGAGSPTVKNVANRLYKPARAPRKIPLLTLLQDVSFNRL